MNILTDELPTTLQIGNTEYQIETDFRSCLRIIMAYEDNDLTPQEKQIVLLTNLYLEIPNDTQYAIQQAMWFLDGGKEDENNIDHPRVCSFDKDANFIFSAFRQTHGIDLQTVHLHWWQFLALFMDLGQDTTFCQLTALRHRLATGKATKEERQAAREMGDLLEIEEIDTRTLEQKEAEQRFMELVSKHNG